MRMIRVALVCLRIALATSLKTAFAAANGTTPECFTTASLVQNKLHVYKSRMQHGQHPESEAKLQSAFVTLLDALGGRISFRSLKDVLFGEQLKREKLRAALANVCQTTHKDGEEKVHFCNAAKAELTQVESKPPTIKDRSGEPPPTTAFIVVAHLCCESGESSYRYAGQAGTLRNGLLSIKALHPDQPIVVVDNSDSGHASLLRQVADDTNVSYVKNPDDTYEIGGWALGYKFIQKMSPRPQAYVFLQAHTVILQPLPVADMMSSKSCPAMELVGDFVRTAEICNFETEALDNASRDEKIRISFNEQLQVLQRQHPDAWQDIKKTMGCQISFPTALHQMFMASQEVMSRLDDLGMFEYQTRTKEDSWAMETNLGLFLRAAGMNASDCNLGRELPPPLHSSLGHGGLPNTYVMKVHSNGWGQDLYHAFSALVQLVDADMSNEVDEDEIVGLLNANASERAHVLRNICSAAFTPPLREFGWRGDQQNETQEILREFHC